MAILAIYAHGKILRVAVKSEACIKTASFPHSESGHEIRAKQILPWLGEHKGIDAELKLIVTNEPSPVARSLGDYFNLLVHVASPATPNECPPQALVTGTPLLKRRCRIDAFTLRFLARQEAEARSLDPASARFIVAHLDEENQLAALVGTEVIDGLTSFDEGPFGLRQS
ncbi:MAG TPA: hypothetical protein DDW87_13975, partial [Firmicutes bacterium]|nr:hypothetical protein [Bacillota bacterium]